MGSALIAIGGVVLALGLLASLVTLTTAIALLVCILGAMFLIGGCVIVAIERLGHPAKKPPIRGPGGL